MTFASDRLYKGYLRRNMPTIASKVKVREIVPHMPCLTDHDRENIEAKRELNGNYDSMVLLLDCLKRRENWPEEFITALEECNQPTLAAEIRREYEALTGNSSSPSASVIKAHVHPAPSAQRLPIPENGGSSEAAVVHPAETPSPPPPAAPPSPPLQAAQRPQSPDTSAVPDSPSQPQRPARLEAAPLPATPPPSPETQHARAANSSPPPPREVFPRQEPVENSVTEEMAVNPAEAPLPPGPVELSESDTPPQGEDAQATADVRPPPSPPATDVTTDVTYGSPFSTATPEKSPVQDTTPPVLQEERTPAPVCTQDAAAAPSPVAAAMEFENDVCLSQPGDLVSVLPPPPDGSALSSMEPYSGNTARLEMSSVAASTTADTSPRLPCQENGVIADYNEPEENHYESPNESLDMEEVRENTLQITEELSILNMDGHDSTPQGQIINGEAAKETIHAPPASGNDHPPEPSAGEGSPPAPQHPEKTPSRLLTSNTKYLVTAAGVGAFALLMAWKFKN